MFFNTVYKLSLWKNIDSKSRNIRLLILGATFYIILHSFLYSKYVEDIELIENNKKYLYYLMVTDLASVGLLMFMNDSKKPKKGKSKNKQSKKNNKQLLPNIIPFNMNRNMNGNMNKNRQMPKQNMNMDMNINGQMPNQNINMNINTQMPNQNMGMNRNMQNSQTANDNDSIKLPIYSKEINTKKIDNDDYDIPVYNYHEEINESIGVNGATNNTPIYQNTMMNSGMDVNNQSIYV